MTTEALFQLLAARAEYATVAQLNCLLLVLINYPSATVPWALGIHMENKNYLRPIDIYGLMNLRKSITIREPVELVLSLLGSPRLEASPAQCV